MSVKFKFLCLVLFLLLTGCKSAPDLGATSTKVAEAVFGTQTASVPSATYTPTSTSTPQFTATPTQTPTLTPTPTPTSTLTPTPIPAVISGWDNIEIASVCMDVLQEYPQFEESVALPVYETAAQILNKMDIDVSQDEAACEATLAIGFEGTVYTSKYSGDGGTLTCYTGSRVNGYMRISKDGYASIDLPISASYSPVAIFGGCSEELTPNVDWDKVWVPEVVNGLADIWGAPVAAAALKAADNAMHRAGVDLVKKYGPAAEETVPLLITMLVEKKGGVAYTDIADALKRIGPGAMPAVPVLIEYLEEELANTSPANFAYHYDNALEAITGQKSGDPSFWKGWWEMVDNQDIETLAKILTNDPSRKNRIFAAESLALIYSGEEIVIQALIDALADEEYSVRIAVMKAIESLGPAASQAAPALAAHGYNLSFSDHDWKFIGAALESIGVESIPPIVEYAPYESKNRIHFLFYLEEITGYEYDGSLSDKDYWHQFLERCMEYYNEHSEIKE